LWAKEEKMNKKTIRLSENFWVFVIPVAVFFMTLYHGQIFSFWIISQCVLAAIIVIYFIYFGLQIEVIEETHKKTQAKS